MSTMNSKLKDLTLLDGSDFAKIASGPDVSGHESFDVMGKWCEAFIFKAFRGSNYATEHRG